MSYWQLPLPSRVLNAKASFLSWEGVPATAKKWDSGIVLKLQAKAGGRTRN